MARLLGARLRAVVLGPRATAVLLGASVLPFAPFIAVTERFPQLRTETMAAVSLFLLSSLIIGARVFSDQVFAVSLPLPTLLRWFPLSALIGFVSGCLVLSGCWLGLAVAAAHVLLAMIIPGYEAFEWPQHVEMWFSRRARGIE